ncbi:dTMP kinase [Actinoplanes sp. NPDC049548]|uniref:dTMP kinase n=1 Tax=Actinoplanes sp. NPDC049548 TaxID=3155152 RepID=UPI0034419B6B
MTGLFVVLDGPSGVGKSTVTKRLTERLNAEGRRAIATREPSDGVIGHLARTGTERFRGYSLACLVTADRYHHLDATIRPALDAGHVVVCDRYLPSSLVLQHLDGVPEDFIWSLNAAITKPDLTIILTGDPTRCRARASARGTYSRFHGASPQEHTSYRNLIGKLRQAGHPVATIDIGGRDAQAVTAEVHALVVQAGESA